jgi:hypothetical protein
MELDILQWANTRFYMFDYKQAIGGNSAGRCIMGISAAMALLLLPACKEDPKVQAKALPQKSASHRTAISPDRHDYLSTEFRARQSAQRQLDAVQKERREDINAEKSFDTPRKGSADQP